MATAGGGTPASVKKSTTPDPDGGRPPSPARNARPSHRPQVLLPEEQPVAERLFNEGFAFEFFQAVRLLQKIDPERKAVGYTAAPDREAVRFRVHQSLSFPPSSIYEIDKPSEHLPAPAMTVAFMGLTGPSGIMPRHYTELLMRIDKDGKGAEKHALRDWFDLYNHRLISLFYRAWEKYRFYIPYEQGLFDQADPDPFTLAVFSIAGLGMPSMRRRLRVSVEEVVDLRPQEKRLAYVDDLALLHYSGLLSHRPRCAIGLEAILSDFFGMMVRVNQFQGQWLTLDPANQSRLGGPGSNNVMGVSLVAGERVWDVQCKFRLRLGPLDYRQFTSFLPDRSAVPERKAFFLLAHLVRLYAGLEFDFDVQLVLNKEFVPECQLVDVGGLGPRLGWNTWIRSQPMQRHAEEAVFDGEDLVWLET